MTKSLETVVNRVKSDEAFRLHLMKSPEDAVSEYDLSPAESTAVGDLADELARAGGELKATPATMWWW